jgi:hypothetical protein
MVYKGSYIFFIPIKYEIFSYNTNNFIFEPKVGRLVELCKFFLAFGNTKRLQIHIQNWTLK